MLGLASTAWNKFFSFYFKLLGLEEGGLTKQEGKWKDLFKHLLKVQLRKHIYVCPDIQPYMDAYKHLEAWGVPEWQYTDMPAHCTYTEHTFSVQ